MEEKTEIAEITEIIRKNRAVLLRRMEEDT